MSYETKFQQKGEKGPTERRKRSNRKEKKVQRKELRSNGTKYEATLWLMLKNRQIDGARFRRQFSVGEYILDFYCPELKLGIELDGQGHYTIEGSLRDGSRDNRLSARGITVLRIENRAIFENQPAVIELLKETVRRLKASGQSV